MPRTLRVLARPAIATALTALCLTAAPAQAQAVTCTGADVIPSAATMATAKAATLCLLNAERATAGLAPLREDAGLEVVADTYSAAMVAQRVFEHVLADGRTLATRLSAYTGPADSWTIGENIAYGESTQSTPRAEMIAWMNSAGHRANILTPGFTDVGIGIAGGTPVGSTVPAATYTTDFGSRELPAPATASPSRTTTATRAVTRRSCTRAAVARVSGSRRRTRTAACARLRRASAARARARIAAARIAVATPVR